MVLQESNMKELRTVELEMLRSFVQVCESLDLKYYVLYGTLLGAVRHHGFIPWDDDIDIGMMRKDYECFIKKAPQYLPDYYFVQCLASDKEYTMNMAKLRDSRTTFIETSVKGFNINHGVYIDILPLDFYPKGKMEAKIFEFKKRLYSQAVRSEYLLQTSANAGQKVIAKVAHFMMKSGKNAAQKLSKLFQEQHPSNYMISNCGPWGNKKEIMPYEWYGDGITVQFEGLDVNAPECTQKWLEHMYGNYMQLPPEEKRVTHHYTEVIDLHHSYKEYKK